MVDYTIFVNTLSGVTDNISLISFWFHICVVHVQKFSLIVRLPDKWFIFQAASNENVEKGHVDSSAIFSPCEGLEPLNMDVKLPRHSSSPPAETFEADVCFMVCL